MHLFGGQVNLFSGQVDLFSRQVNLFGGQVNLFWWTGHLCGIEVNSDASTR